MKILVCGYYHRQNLGDDAFEAALPLLFPHDQLVFQSIDSLAAQRELDCDAMVVGGGDLINDYFYKNLLPAMRSLRAQGRPIIALGIGLPYPQLIDQGYLDCFDHVFVRAKRDVRPLQRRLGSVYAHYLPDLAFALPRPLHEAPIAKRVGVFLAQPIASQTQVLESLVRLFWKLSKRYQLVLYRFDSSGRPNQDEASINSAIQDRLAALAEAKPRSARSRQHILVNGSVWLPDRMLAEMQRCELAICMRFHSHVFAMMAGVPFLSLSQTRKVDELLWDADLATFSCEPSAPSSQMLHLFDRVADSADELRSRMRAFAQSAARQLATTQPRQLIEHSTRPNAVADTLAFAHGQHALDRECRTMSTEFSALLDNSEPERVAELLCWRLTRNPHSAYLHGMREKMRERDFDRGLLFEMIKWVKLDLLKRRSSKQERRLDLHYMAQEMGEGLHRSGWQYCIDYLEVMQGERGLICDTYLDRSFHWARELLVEQGLLPYTSPWIGFLHHTASSYTEFNAVRLIESELFQRSLPTCQGIVCLSEALAGWLRSRLPVTVIALQHPTEFVETAQRWSRNRFLANAERRLIQVGGWYRNPWTLHTLRADQCALFSGRAALRGKSMEAYFAPERWILKRKRGVLSVRSPDEFDCAGMSDMCRLGSDLAHNKWLHYLLEWLDTSSLLEGLPRSFTIKFGMHRKPRHALRPLYAELKRLFATVTRLDYLDDAAYDRLLAENVVFLDLVDASACNALIECVVRCTPIVVNRLPAVEEYLGKHYPLYWPVELNLENITKAWHYLQELDKSGLRVSHFVDALRSSTLLRGI